MNNMKLAIQHVLWAERKQELQQIRIEVFIQEQGVSVVDEWDGLDETAAHFLVWDSDGKAIATARVLTETVSALRFHIGRVAVRKSYRNKGVGRQLMSAVMAWCSMQKTDAEQYLYAQLPRKHFYEQVGFIAEGQEFMDAGIAHVAMRYHPL